VPEPRRARLETAVELVRVVDEARAVATGEQVAGRQGVEVVRVNDVEPHLCRGGDDTKRLKHRPADTK
jgi:hypothetical protein